MQKEVTITIDEEVYEKLQRSVGQEHISQFIESVIRPHVMPVDLELAYKEMAEDEGRESKALEWSESTVGDVSDETR